jgi:hypothetical protein
VIDGSQSRQILPEIVRQKLLRMIAVLHLPFNIVERDEFRDFMLYCSPALRGNDTLPKSSTSVKTWLLEYFLLSQLVLIQLLLVSGAKVHISFDLWSSANHYSMLGIVCHFIDRNFKARTVMLGLKRLVGPHSGENMSRLLIETIETYKLAHVLGFCVLDNARDNDTSLRSVQAYLLLQGVTWCADAHRLRCFGHIVNLIASAFIANKPLKVIRAKGEPKPLKVKWVRPSDALSKLHYIIVFIMVTAQRIEEFMKINKDIDDEVLHPVKENDTRWFSTYLMIIRAILLRNSIDLFVAQHLTSTKDEKNLADFVLSSDDWKYCSEVSAFMKPLYVLVKELEGKSNTGM